MLNLRRSFLLWWMLLQREYRSAVNPYLQGGQPGILCVNIPVGNYLPKWLIFLQTSQNVFQANKQSRTLQRKVSCHSLVNTRLWSQYPGIEFSHKTSLCSDWMEREMCQYSTDNGTIKPRSSAKDLQRFNVFFLLSSPSLSPSFHPSPPSINCCWRHSPLPSALRHAAPSQPLHML